MKRLLRSKNLFACCLALILFTLSISVKAQTTCPGKSFFSYTGGDWSYTQANNAGFCYKNLEPGKTYCFSYKQPANGIIEVDFNINSCQTCLTSTWLDENGTSGSHVVNASGSQG